ncbi:hypothetical protein EDM53_03290 [Rickettsiales endosymbiont of Peranema trichophorum]|uniref:hypothetical protein n=1 Tax=Rickettsiales endosymbiont of Peranema trichophorum TaxID=2486577 RepID=UPI001023093E|nr:hypothetical protein [Rickettsiales endosymbiont of Peranema trichophorum]RZI47176.1 hypothetical protein EDM53_03290 [Rickettsiales endosymbiont of Peranema trichophorum]
MKPKELNIEMTYTEFKKICDGLDNGNLEEAIEGFISNHSGDDLSRDDVLSLTLYKAIIYGRANVVDKILSTPHTESILTPIIESYDSVIRKMFGQERTSGMIRETDGSVFGVILEYLKHNRDIPLVDLEGQDFVRMYNMLELPRWDVTTDDGWWYIRKYFLDSLYTKESLDKLDESLYREFDRAEYLKDYEEQQKKEMLKLQSKVEEDDDAEDSGTNEDKSDGDRRVQMVATDNKPSIRSEGASDGIGEEIIVYEGSRDRSANRKDGGSDVIVEVLKSWLGWIEELPVWLQEHVMKRHSVERVLEYVKSCSNGLVFQLFEEDVNEISRDEESEVMNTWDVAREEHIWSQCSELIYDDAYAYQVPVVMSGVVNGLYGVRAGLEEMYKVVEQDAVNVEDALAF